MVVHFSKFLFYESNLLLFPINFTPTGFPLPPARLRPRRNSLLKPPKSSMSSQISFSSESDFWDDKWDSDSSDRYGGNKQRNGRRHSIASEFEFNDSDFKGKKGKRKSNRDSSEWSGGSSWENDFSDGRKGGDSGFGGDWSSADMDSFESDENDIPALLMHR